MITISQIKKHVKVELWLLLAMLPIFFIGIGAYVYQVVKDSQKKALYGWQVTLNEIADTKLSDVDHWIEAQYKTLETLAENTSLKLYMTESKMLQGEGESVQDEPFQMVYLRNLLIVTAERTGFSHVADKPSVPVNLPFKGTVGIALLDKNHTIVVATPDMPLITGKLKEFVKKVLPAGRGMSDLYYNEEGQLMIAFAVPVFDIQGRPAVESQIGSVIGVRTVKDSLFPLLMLPEMKEKTMEVVLVKADYLHNTLLYLTPLRDGSAPLSKSLNATDESLEAVYAIMHPGHFAVKRDYMYHEVFVTGRRIDQAMGWVLIAKVNKEEALAENNARKVNLINVSLFLIILVILMIFALWRHRIAIQEKKAAKRHKMLAEKYAAQKELLKIIADNKPEALFIVDENNHCCFANLEAVRQAEMGFDEVIGKPLKKLVGNGRLLEYIRLNSTALLENKIISHVHYMQGGKSIIQSKHIPLPAIPGFQGKGVLILEQDITEPMVQQQRLAKINHSVIRTLVALLEKKDSFTADHSLRVAKLSKTIASELGLDEVNQETAEIAGLLMHLGKLLVPVKILTKKTKLTKPEEAKIREALQQNTGLLSEIDFEGPVVETIEQAHNRIFKRESKKKHLLTADIIACADIFVTAMYPPSYASVGSLSLDEVLDKFRKTASTQQDKSIIAALSHYIENKGGREEWRR